MTRPRPPSCLSLLAVCGFVLCCFLARARASDYEVIINEIHYNPLGPALTADLEFIEIHNLGSETADLGGWSFAEGIHYALPQGLEIGPKEYLVFSPDPERARVAYGLSRAAGPYEGRLDNNGEIVSLFNSAGQMVSRVHYGDSGVWPSLPDGFGPSLEFTGEDNGNDLHSRWAASLVIGGTPGKRNSTYAPPASLSEAAGSDLLPVTSTFTTFKGTAAPSSPALAWTDVGYDDGAWTVLPGAFGYGNIQGYSYTTQLGDMRGRYSTFYIRGSFDLSEDDLAAVIAGEKKLAVHVLYDDAFVAYLNGVEVGRDNVGTPGTAVAYNTYAAATKTAEAEVALSSFKAALRSGRNVLAVQGVNARAFGPFGDDFFIGASLSIEASAPPPPPESEGSLTSGVLNEYGPGGPGAGFVELFNPRKEPLDLGGSFLRLGLGQSFELPPSIVLDPGAFQVLGADSLGFSLPLAEETCVLLEPDGSTLIDALKVAPSGSANSAGRFPDGNEDVFVMTAPSPGQPNVYACQSQVVINEIHFHPAYVPPEGTCLEKCSYEHQWIELWNTGSSEVDLTGWSLSKGVSYAFASGAKIPAGQGLVVAASLSAFEAMYPGVENVVGNWTGRLAHSSDTINLRDALGNRVDHVKYGDGEPTNDEAPDDGVDDRTFRGSPWPSGADGTGRTLELVSPALENRSGLSWRASLSTGGTPGASNSVLDLEPDPVVDAVAHAPQVPRSDEAVAVTCRISAPGGIQSAVVEWALDGAAFSPVPLSDDGSAPDASAGDGVFSAAIPAQADRSVVLFRIRVQDTRGGSLTVPVPPAVSPYGGFTGPFFLYEVDDTGPPANGSPSYRIVMTGRDLQQLRSRDLNSNVLLPCTFIGGSEVHHVAGIRFRGETARREPNRSYRVEFPSESPFDGAEKLNLNGSNGGALGASIVNDMLACDLFRRAGVPSPEMYPVNLRFPGEVTRDWDSRYGRKENVDEDFLERFFGGSDEGNLYRAMNPGGPGRPSGDLSYLDTDPNEYRDLYAKKSNREEDDFSDIIALTRAFNRAQTPDAIFPEELEKLIDPVEWARFFAMESILSNIDGGIWNNNGEDYFLYHVPADSERPDKGKFLILPWDLEETFSDAGEPLLQPVVASIRRFLTHPQFARLYYQELATLREGVGSRSEMRRSFGFVSRMFRPADVFDVVDPLDSFWTARLGYLDVNVSPNLTVGPVSSTAAGTTVIAPGEVWKFFRGRAAPPGGDSWTEPGYDDGAWESGPTGIGYGDGDDATELADMLDSYTTVFARKTFQVVDPAAVTSLTLLVDYDDAFVAYVNGHEVARSAGAPGSAGDPVSFDATSRLSHEAGTAESFALSTAAAQLVAGDNVLAAVAINNGADSSDLSFIPTLAITTTEQQGSIAGGCGGPVYATGSEILLAGAADAAVTQAVRVNGELARLSYVTSGDGPFGAVWNIRLPLPASDSTFQVTAHADPEGLGPAVRTADILVLRLQGSFTQVGGTLAGDTTWTAAGGPYRLVQSVQVPPGITLAIEAGTVVLGDGGTGITVRGRIVADGEEGKPIRFGAFSCDSPWGGILIQNTGTGEGAPVETLRHCVIEHAQALAGAQGVIAPVNSSVLLDRCTLRSLDANAVDGTGADIVVQGCLFEDISEGVHCAGSLVVIEDTVFRHMIGDNDAIDFDSTARGRCRIARCRIEDSTDDGIDLSASSVDILDNVFSRIADKAISIEGNGPDGGPTAARNLIHGSTTGMALKDGVTIDGDHNTITECQEGLSLFAKDAGPQGGHGAFHSLIVWNNFADVLLDGKSTVEITFSDVGGDAPWPGEGNIAESPGFAAPGAANYSLLPGSPCIGTGLGASDMGALPFASTPEATFLRFDANEGGQVDISDAIATLRFLFQGDSGPECWDRMDADDDGSVNITDPIFGLRFLFQGGTSIPPPYPEPGVDPTQDELPCPP